VLTEATKKRELLENMQEKDRNHWIEVTRARKAPCRCNRIKLDEIVTRTELGPRAGIFGRSERAGDV